MRLRGRFTLWFGLAAVLPILAATLISRELVMRQHRAESQRELLRLERLARSELDRLSKQVARAAESMAAEPVPERAVALAGLQTLATPARPSEAPVIDWHHVASRRGLFVAGTRFAQSRQPVTVGRELDADFVRALTATGGDARIVDIQGRELISTRRPWPSTAQVATIPLGAAARLELIASKSNLVGTLADVTVATLALGLVAVLFAFALGYGVSRRMTGDLDRLVEAAEAVSEGQLDHRVEVRARDEIGELAQAFNSMTDDLRESKEQLVRAERIAAWQDVARRIAHEIKNPLTPIQMSVETMRKTYEKRHPSFDEIFVESTTTVLEEVRRLERIVSEFSRFARLPAPRRQPMQLNEVVSSALALYRGAAAVTPELDASLPGIDADRDQLTQVILNLVENARDAVGTAEEGAIVVRTFRGDRSITLEIEDNGPGIDPQVADKLFTPYVTTKVKGTGLGLAIAHRIITEHGGTITVRSATPRGARFVVELPT